MVRKVWRGCVLTVRISSVSFLGTWEESFVKWRGYRHAFLTLLNEKLLSKVTAV